MGVLPSFALCDFLLHLIGVPRPGLYPSVLGPLWLERKPIIVCNAYRGSALRGLVSVSACIRVGKALGSRAMRIVRSLEHSTDTSPAYLLDYRNHDMTDGLFESGHSGSHPRPAAPAGPSAAPCVVDNRDSWTSAGLEGAARVVDLEVRPRPGCR